MGGLLGWQPGNSVIYKPQQPVQKLMPASHACTFQSVHSKVFWSLELSLLSESNKKGKKFLQLRIHGAEISSASEEKKTKEEKRAFFLFFSPTDANVAMLQMSWDLLSLFFAT